jgi:DNA-binding NarL/FixJ family response regulator
MTPPLKILLIEDSPEITEALEQTLEAEDNMTVVGHADNAARAIHALETMDVDAVVVDLNLREGSGLQVLSHLHRNGNPKSILRIVLTNHATPVFRRTCESFGAEYFFDKSLEFDRAIEVLKERASPLPSRQ